MSNIWGTAAGLGAIGVSAFIVKDSADGTRTKRNDAAAAFREHAEWQDLEYGMGHWSGNPWMDKKAHGLKRLLLFGPMNLRIKWQEGNMRVNSWVNDVFLPNLVPIAIGAIGLVSMIGWGRTGKGFRTAGETLAKGWNSGTRQNLWTELKSKVFSPIGDKTKDGSLKLLDLIFKSPTNFGITLGIGVLVNFALKRFQDSYGHDGQEAYFRDLVNTKGH